MEIFVKEHQLIIKIFPFVLLEVKDNDINCHKWYFINGKVDHSFWYNPENKWWNGYSSKFSATRYIKIFLEELYNYYIMFYDKLS